VQNSTYLKIFLRNRENREKKGGQKRGRNKLEKIKKKKVCRQQRMRRCEEKNTETLRGIQRRKKKWRRRDI